MRRTAIYDHTDFWPVLEADIMAAMGSIDIHSPFISKQAMVRWHPLLRDRAAQGVKIRVFLQQPRDWSKRSDPIISPRVAAELAQFQSLIEWLQAIGAAVLLRERIHAKLILIDEHILWEGSLNFLSHFDTTEHLRRSVNTYEVHQIRRRHMLKQPRNQDDYSLQKQFRILIEKRMNELGMTQADLASAVGCKPMQISRLKRGLNAVLSPIVEKVLKKLGLDLIAVPSYLLGPTNKFIQSAIKAADERWFNQGIPISDTPKPAANSNLLKK